MAKETGALSRSAPFTPSGIVADRPLVALPVGPLAGLVVLFALIMTPLLGPLAVLLFLAAGGLMIATRFEHSAQAAARYWPLFLLPLFCLLSTLWSQYPGVTLRYAIQLGITVLVAVVMAVRVSPKLLLRYLFGIYAFGIVASALFGRVRDDIGAWVGIFGSKNAFAAVASGLALTSLAVLFDRSAPKLLRLAALGGLGAAFPFLLLAQSTGHLIATVVALGISFLVLATRRVGPKQKMTLLAAAFMVALLLAGFVYFYGEMLLADLLQASGKDPTITGRTDLWAVGLDSIRQHPLLGIGYQAFWVQGSGPAEMLWAMFGIKARAGFHFHNMYISNTVEIGLIGMAIELAIIFGALFALLRWIVRSSAPENAYLLSFLTALLCTSFAEVPVFFQFNISTVIVVIAFVHATQMNEVWRARDRALPHE